jgi:hypothetical protein
MATINGPDFAAIAEGDSGFAFWNDFTGVDDSSDYVTGGDDDNAKHGGDGNDLGAFENLTSTGDGANDGTGTAWDNVLSGGDSSDASEGGHTSHHGGTDTSEGGHHGGEVDLGGGSGADVIDGTFEDLTLTDDGSIDGTGNAGDDVLSAIDGGEGGYFTYSGEGEVYLDAGSATDVLYDGAGNDGGEGDSVPDDGKGTVVIGGGGDDVLYGGSGADVIHGGNGDDFIEGGDGYDVIEGGSGADVIDGGDGHDYTTYWHSSAGVTVSLATGVGSGGDAEGDTLISIESLYGSNFDDHLTGNADSNWI